MTDLALDEPAPVVIELIEFALHELGVEQIGLFDADDAERLDELHDCCGGLRPVGGHPGPLEERIDPAHHSDCLDDGDINQRHRLADQPARQTKTAVPRLDNQPADTPDIGVYQLQLSAPVEAGKDTAGSDVPQFQHGRSVRIDDDADGRFAADTSQDEYRRRRTCATAEVVIACQPLVVVQAARDDLQILTDRTDRHFMPSSLAGR